MGYKNSVIRLDFPEMSEEDDPIWIVMRNPKTLPSGFFRTDAVMELPPPYVEPVVPGETVAEAEQRLKRDFERRVLAERKEGDLAMRASNDMFARMIVDSRVYNGETDELMTGRLSVEQVAMLPSDIISKMSDVLREATNPTVVPGPTTTGNGSGPSNESSEGSAEMALSPS